MTEICQYNLNILFASSVLHANLINLKLQSFGVYFSVQDFVPLTVSNPQQNLIKSSSRLVVVVLVLSSSRSSLCVVYVTTICHLCMSLSTCAQICAH